MRRPVSTLSEANPPAPVRILSVGADGDGVAALPDGTALFLPYTLPGELVQPGPLARRGRAYAADATILDPSPDRVEPPCPHFGSCGGCTLQHWRDERYEAWKTERVRNAVGSQATVTGLARTPPGARRRMALAIRRLPGTVVIGLHRRRSTDIVDMHACPVLHPRLFATIQALRPVLLRLDALRREATAIVNLLDSGPDLLLRTDAPLSATDRIRLAGLAAATGLPRISWAIGPRGEPETACQLRPATTALGGTVTAPPPGAFLQASAEGEAAIQAAVLDGLPTRLPAKAAITELFAGCGTLTHALATRARVLALEGDGPAVNALTGARNQRVTAVKRDLMRQPIAASELRGSDAVVLDPPYDGAAPQLAALAASGKPVIYVSCNPEALARDGRILLEAGYQLRTLAAIDQFLWSADVEAVAVFTRTTRPGKSQERH